MFKRLIVVSMVLGVLTILCAAHGESSRESMAPEAKDLVSIKVRGTIIDLQPKYVDVITVSPQAEARKLVAAGGKRNEGHAHETHDPVFYRGMFFSFRTPDFWKKSTNYNFEDGDVIYTYLADSSEEKDEFQARYKLAGVTDLTREAATSFPLYRASARHYVLILTRVSGFTCSMHPQVMKPEAGKCPICRMQLIRAKQYE